MDRAEFIEALHLIEKEKGIDYRDHEIGFGNKKKI